MVGYTTGDYSDMINMKQGLPLQETSHGQYLATKPPVRKNKDYRARPRNYVIGFSVFRKDCHTRHLYTIKDVLENNDAPIMKYTKTFLWASLYGLIGSTLYYTFKDTILNNTLSKHMNSLQGQTYDVFQPIKLLKSSIGKLPFKFAIVFGTSVVVYKFVVETLQ
jgi:hypothetical protein